MTLRALWLLIAVLVVAIIFVAVKKRRWHAVDPHALQEIEKAKQR